MGIEISDYVKDSDSSPPVAQLLQETKQMSSEELKIYFEKLFQRMNPQAKEALTEILWTGLNPSEQQAFQMPYFGSRWSQDSITAALDNAFIQPSQQHSTRRTFSDQVPTHGREEQLLEDHFFTILREAIHRADQRPRQVPVRMIRRRDTVEMNIERE